jgi:hypothetical protein
VALVHRLGREHEDALLSRHFHTLRHVWSALGKRQRSKPKVSRAYHPLRAVVPVKVYLNASARCDEAFPNTTFRATEMAGSSVLGSARFIRHY